MSIVDNSPRSSLLSTVSSPSPVLEESQRPTPYSDLDFDILRTIRAYNALTEEPQTTIAAVTAKPLLPEQHSKLALRCEPPQARATGRNVDLVWIPPPVPERVQKPGRRVQGSVGVRFLDKENSVAPIGSATRDAESTRRRTRLSSFSHSTGSQARSPFSNPTTAPPPKAPPKRTSVILPPGNIHHRLRQHLAICALPIPTRLRYAPNFFLHPYIDRNLNGNAGPPTPTIVRRKDDETALLSLKPKIRYLDSPDQPFRHPHRFEVVVTAPEGERHESYWNIQPCPEEAPCFHVEPARLRPIKRRRGKEKVIKPIYAYVLDRAADYRQVFCLPSIPGPHTDVPSFTRRNLALVWSSASLPLSSSETSRGPPTPGFEYQKAPRLSLRKRIFLSRKKKAEWRATLRPDPRAAALLKEAREELGDVEAPGQ
ncbi:hypothetical protein VTO73DRAFT_8842 [Trametes versicolor]